MTNVSHASLTGSQLHEPKGVASATSGTVYVADGAGSGTWSSVGTSSFTGMIADFTWPVVQDGWLELDGSTISTTTYSALYNVMAISTTGTRTNGSAVITSIPSTTHFRVGYYIFGTGFSSGTTILSIDSSTQITVSNNASSSGTAGSIAVSPWLLNTGTIKLPDVSTAGRFRRSRTSSTAVGQTQADQNQSHTHSLSVTGTSSSDGSHTHTASVTDPGHTHAISVPNSSGSSPLSGVIIGGTGIVTATNSATTGITVSNASTGAHTHTMTSTGTSGSNGGTEARPLAIIVMTCVKT